MGLWDIACVLGEMVSDGVSELTGKADRDRARWRAEVQENAKKTRINLIKHAHKLWLLRNKNAKDLLVVEYNTLIEMQNALQQARVGLVDEAHVNAIDTAPQIKKIPEEKLHMPSLYNNIELRFYYDSNYFYGGNDDEFVEHIDQFMCEQLKGHKGLMSSWRRKIKAVKEIYL